MRMPRWMLRLLDTGPAAVASTAMTLVVLDLLPSPLELGATLMYAAVIALIAFDRLERPAVLAIGRSREPDEKELVALTSVLARVGPSHDWFSDVYVARGVETPLAVMRGRRSLVVSRRCLAMSETSANNASAAVMCAVGRHRARAAWCDLTVAAWTAPWSAVVSIGRGALAPLRPLWRLRVIAAIVCVVQSSFYGDPAIGLSAGALVALTYLTPAARAELERRAQQLAEEFVAEHDAALRRGDSPQPPALVKT